MMCLIYTTNVMWISTIGTSVRTLRPTYWALLCASVEDLWEQSGGRSSTLGFPSGVRRLSVRGSGKWGWGIYPSGSLPAELPRAGCIP